MTTRWPSTTPSVPSTSSWVYDNEPAGQTWLRVVSGSQPIDRGIMTSHYIEAGWLKALEDNGVKGRFVSYEQIAGGELISKGYKVLIMDRTMAMSPEEIAAVEAFADAGGVVIADNQTAIYDGHCKRRSIADGGGLMDSWFGIQRADYLSTEYRGETADAYTGDVVLQTPPAGFEALTQGLGGTVSAGWHAAETGLRAGDGTPVGHFGGDPEKPVLIVKSHGAGKSVYMNLSLMCYAWTPSGNAPADRSDPDGDAAVNVRHLVRNLIALAGVTGKVRVLRGYDAADSAPEVYNLEKARYVDGSIVYLGCVVNSHIEDQNWSLAQYMELTLFGDQWSGPDGMVTLVLEKPYYVYDVRKKTYLGYGARINAQQPIYQGGVFALMPYKVASLHVDELTLDAKQRATIRVSVRPEGDVACGRHVFRVVVLDADGNEVPGLARNVVARGGVWEDMIPFAMSDDLTGWHVKITDIATSVTTEVTAANHYAGDINGDGSINVGDLMALAAGWGASEGSPSYTRATDINADGYVNVGDLQLLVANWGKD